MAQQTGRAEAARAKRAAALTSVAAGAGLTAAKVLIGVLTGSLGILAEAAHSGLDLVADALVGLNATHEVRIYESLEQPGGADGHLPRSQTQAREHDLVLHVSFPGDLAMPEVHERSEEIERALRSAVPNLAHVLIHAEPRGEG